uniref:Uncharacterized protein n=1 Tax=Pristionchus pacificus TaxID=54126 RepID=A0A2A6C915_PRIPA|eukprot:PDM74596.1 hypothetical protein PRIPAC_41952 [Pristionchus pacificus]
MPCLVVGRLFTRCCLSARSSRLSPAPSGPPLGSRLATARAARDGRVPERFCERRLLRAPAGKEGNNEKEEAEPKQEVPQVSVSGAVQYHTVSITIIIHCPYRQSAPGTTTTTSAAVQKYKLLLE